MSCTVGLGAISFILSETIPIFNYLVALIGSVCFAPLAMCLPGFLWLHSNGHYRKGTLMQKVIYLLHWGMVLLGIFFLVGATYGVIIQIIDAYATGMIGMFCYTRNSVELRLTFFIRLHFQLLGQLQLVVGMGLYSRLLRDLPPTGVVIYTLNMVWMVIQELYNEGPGGHNVCCNELLWNRNKFCFPRETLQAKR